MGPAGLDGRTVLNGTSDPSGGIGTNGDFYINTTTNFIFGPKSGGTWPAGVSLVGPEGPGGSGSAWGLTGNAGTDTTTNFIGTTDGEAIVFKVNGQFAGAITSQGISFGLNSHRPGNAVDENCAYGVESLRNATGVGIANAAFGRQTLRANTTGSSNSAFGQSALVANTVGTANTGIGSSALGNNTTGQNNTAVGYRALFSNTTGRANVAVGQNALRLNTDRSNLVAIGDSALFNNSVGAPQPGFETPPYALWNTAVGSKALFANTSGSENTAIGSRAMYNNASGHRNTAIGVNAMSSMTSGLGHTAVGINAMPNNTGGMNCTALGNLAGGSSTTPSNFMSLGYLSGFVGGNSNTVEVGNSSVNWIGGQVGFSTYSDGRIKTRVQENVPGLDFITRLRPVTYNFDLHQQYAMVHGGDQPGEWEGKFDLEKKQMTGFIAQEVEAAARASGYDFSGVHAPEGNSKLYSLTYSEFVVPLVKAVQEQQAMIEKLEERLRELENK